MYSGSTHSRSSYGSSSTTIILPQSMPAGAIIGKGGQNIKLLQQRSGARVVVSYSGSEVVISGGSVAVQAAAELVRQQIESFMASGGGYHHPLQVHYLLSNAYGCDAQASIKFLLRRDEVARAAGRPEQLYQLQPAGPARALSPAEDRTDAMIAALAGFQLGRPQGTSIHTAGQQPWLVRQAAAAAAQGAEHRPAFNRIKISFNFGKQLWYFPRTAAPYSWTIQEMQAKEIPKDIKSVFSNGVQASHVQQLEKWLASRGFQRGETKARAVAHLLQHGANAAYSLSFNKQSDGKLALRKAKTGSSKLCFLNLLNSSSQPDWRAKLLGQYHIKQGSEIHALLTSLAASATLAIAGDGSSKLHIPGLRAADMSMDKERHKTKTVYLGSYCSSSSGGGQATSIKVSISRVLTADGYDDGYEVAGTSPQANALLQEMLRSGTASAAQQAELAAHVDSMLAFAQEAAAALSN